MCKSTRYCPKHFAYLSLQFRDVTFFNPKTVPICQKPSAYQHLQCNLTGDTEILVFYQYQVERGFFYLTSHCQQHTLRTFIRLQTANLYWNQMPSFLYKVQFPKGGRVLKNKASSTNFTPPKSAYQYWGIQLHM